MTINCKGKNGQWVSLTKNILEVEYFSLYNKRLPSINCNEGFVDQKFSIVLIFVPKNKKKSDEKLMLLLV